MKKTNLFYLVGFIFLFMSCQKEELNSTDLTLDLENSKGNKKGIKYGKVKDIDKNVYKTVQIGNQVWMAENLSVTRYKNGDPIPQVTDQTEWANLTTGAWCYLNNNLKNGHTYGKLYNWYAVKDPRGLAPEGWHVPAYSELLLLNNYLGVGSGGMLKEAGTKHWASPNIEATNSSGFTALPGGIRLGNDFDFRFDQGERGYFWSSTAGAIPGAPIGYPLYPMAITLFNTSGYYSLDFAYEYVGMSVRCVKD